ncbi:hypothetical protein NDR87_18485 [Nocardia sp. CDC159]|uniref:Uncharacterized protein n=1 Tax=Nocardia pulmonis TaxID=2951408 RepID=A0A9X2IX60_9NOCA|nr:MULTISPECIES: hypothetical protein [Nocardia]MCM6775672.1 hypothetical protein [Nocardia pulmonis]MCM6788352.1 hypothetical protein [Nocardia sp. CDC159]
MSTGLIACFAACALALVTIVLRASKWRQRPQSRPFTVTLTLLVVGVALRNPAVLAGTWLNGNTAIDLHLANATDLLGDLCYVAAGYFICTLVARAWGLAMPMPWLAGVFTIGALAMVALWVGSDAPTTPAVYVGYLGGPALAYSYVAASLILLSNLALVATAAIAQSSWRVRLALLPLALGGLLGVIEGLLRIGSHIRPEPWAELRDRIGWYPSVAMIVLYAVSGLIGYFMYASITRERRADRVAAE